MLFLSGRGFPERHLSLQDFKHWLTISIYRKAVQFKKLKLECWIHHNFEFVFDTWYEGIVICYYYLSQACTVYVLRHLRLLYHYCAVSNNIIITASASYTCQKIFSVFSIYIIHKYIYSYIQLCCLDELLYCNY